MDSKADWEDMWERVQRKREGKPAQAAPAARPPAEKRTSRAAEDDKPPAPTWNIREIAPTHGHATRRGRKGGKQSWFR